MSDAQEQEWVPCWCGKPAAYTEFGEHGSPPILLCMDHKPQYEIKEVRGAVYGPETHPFEPCEWKLAGRAYMMKFCDHPNDCHFGRARPEGICDLPLSDPIHLDPGEPE